MTRARCVGAAALLGLAALVLAAPGARAETLKRGDEAPNFELRSVSGSEVTRDHLTGSGLSILSFLALDSKPSRELAVTLSGMRKGRKASELNVVGIARDSKEELRKFADGLDLDFDLCSDRQGEVMEKYGAAKLVPITYVIGPDAAIAEVVRGGGMTSQHLLLAVAEKEFARGNVEVAERLYGDVVKEDPKNAKARAGKGFALARAGKLERAEAEFAELGSLGGDGKALAAEGRAEVALRRGDLEVADREAVKAGAKSVHAAVVRGQVAARRGKTAEAATAFQKASAGEATFAWQRGLAFNNLARVMSDAGEKELPVYDKAIAAEPFLVEAQSNKGAALAEAGRPHEAKKQLARAQSIAPRDELVATLLRRLEQREKEGSDVERRKLVDKLVDDLAAAYRSGKATAAQEDEWAPRRAVISFLDLRDERDATARAGLVEAFVARATERILASGRFDVVERETIDRLLAELKLGSSEVADPATRLKLGRVLAAAVIATGSFSNAGGADQLELRLIDTETTEIRTTASKTVDPAQVAAAADEVADRLLAELRKSYPLRGKIAEVDGDEIVVAIGAKHGLAEGAELDVVELGKPVEVDGKVVGHRKKKIGRLKVVSVEDGFAVAKPVSGDAFAEGQRLIEVAEK